MEFSIPRVMELRFRVGVNSIDFAILCLQKEGALALTLLKKGCPRQESNLHRRFRKPLLCPLSYEDTLFSKDGIALSVELWRQNQRKPISIIPFFIGEL